MTHMEKRHFKFIADVIRDDLTLGERERRHVAEVFKNALRRTNEGFKSDTFLKACGVITVGSLEEKF